MKSANFILSAMLGLGLGLAACDNGAKQKGGSKKAGASDDDDSTNTGDDDDSTGAPAGDGDFNGWCKKAGETDVVQKTLAEYFGKLCDGDTAKSLFSSTLVKAAYGGSGTPKIKSLADISSDPDKKETTAYFGVGIKLPISAKDHFDKVGPKAGDDAAAKRLATASKATSTLFEIKDTFKNDSKYEVRGWRIHSVNTQTTGGVAIETETVARSDQFELDPGKLYMYTQVTEEGIKTVKEFNMITAGIQIGDSGYLITVAHLVVDNHGLAAVAESKIVETANSLIKSMYKAAELEAGGGTAAPADPAAGLIDIEAVPADAPQN